MKEFVESAYRDDDGTYIVNGDEPAFNAGDLHEFYKSLVGHHSRHVDSDSLVVNRVKGVDDKWSATVALNLTYCVSTKFQGDHTLVGTPRRPAPPSG